MTQVDVRLVTWRCPECGAAHTVREVGEIPEYRAICSADDCRYVGPFEREDPDAA